VRQHHGIACTKMIPVMQRTLCKLYCQVVIASLAGDEAHAVQGVHPLRQIVEVLPASTTNSSQEDSSGGHQCLGLMGIFKPGVVSAQ